jgi:hypothetical protein
MMVAMLYERDVPTFVAPAIVLVMGAFIGAVSGLLVTKIRIPSFLVTLGMLSFFSGLALTVTDTRPVPILDDTFSALFWNGSFVGVQAPICWTLALTALGYYLLHQMPFGRRIFATGGNPIAARFSGVRTDRTKIAAFVISGVTASLAGMMLAAPIDCRQPKLGRWTRARCDRRRDHRRYKSFRRLRIDRRLSGRRDLHWHSWIRSSGDGTVDHHSGGHQGRDHNSGGVSEPTVAGYAPRRFWLSESNRTARKITAPWMN